MHGWQVWLVAALLLFVAEMLAPGFWLLSVAVGCLAAGVVSLFVPAAIALFAISIVARGIRIVQQAQTMIIERLGKYHRTLSSGVNLIIPIIDKPRAIDWHQVIVTPAGESFARHFRTDKIDLRET